MLTALGHSRNGSGHPLSQSIGRSAVAQTRTFRLAIRAPVNGHSLSAILPVSLYATGHFEKEQSGTDFGKGRAPDGSRRTRPGDFSAMGRLRE